MMGRFLLAALIALGAEHAFIKDANAVQADESRREIYWLFPVGSIVLQPDEKILVGCPYGLSLRVIDEDSGEFGVFGGGIFRFNRDGTLDRSFISQRGRFGLAADVFETWLALASDGRVLAKAERGQIVRLLPDGRLDNSFAIQSPDTNAPGLWVYPRAVRSFTLAHDGSILVRGTGTNRFSPFLSGVMVTHPPFALHRFDRAGRFLGSARPRYSHGLAATLTHQGIALLKPQVIPQEGRAADLICLSPITEPVSQQFAHPGATEALKILAEEVPLSLWRHAVRLPDGGAVVTMTDPAGGQFIRFDRNWRMDRTFTNRFELRFPSDLNLAMDTRGGLLVSGNFLSLNGRPFTGIARLLPTGAIDPNFSARILDTTAIPARVSVADLAVQPDGRVLIGGLFTQINGMECTYLARLNSDGSLDRQFSSRFSQARYQQALRRLRTPRIASRSDAALVQASAARGNIATAPAAIPSIAEAPREASPPADSETIVIQSLELNTNGVAIQFLGAANHTYILQVRESWDAGEWVSVVSSQTDATGAGVFQDEGAAWKPIAFYRILRMP